MSVKVDKVEFKSEIGVGKINEDACGYKENTFWVLDGATGLNKRNLSDDISDAHWYTNWWDKYLNDNSFKDINLKDIMYKGIKKVDDDYQKFCVGKKVEKIDFPSASITIIRVNDEKLEYFILGDCRLYIDDGCKVQIIHDDSVSKLDNNIFNAMLDMEDFYSIDLSQSLSILSEQIIENRMKNNCDDGYWILSFDEKAIDKAKYGIIDIEKDIRIMIASDGYYSYSDKYRLIEEDLLIDETFKYGIDIMINQIRNFEDDKDRIRRIPRFKDKDDCTCLCINIEKINE